MRRLPQSCGPGIGSSSPDELGTGKTPQLKIQPTEEAKPPAVDAVGSGSAGAAPTPINPPPPAAPLDAGAPGDVTSGNPGNVVPGTEGDPNMGSGSGSAVPDPNNAINGPVNGPGSGSGFPPEGTPPGGGM